MTSKLDDLMFTENEADREYQRAFATALVEALKGEIIKRKECVNEPLWQIDLAFEALKKGIGE